MPPFRVVFDLAEPVLVNRSVAFDGLLAHRTWLRTGDAATAHLSLPLAESDGIWQASELLFLGPLARRRVTWVMNSRWERFDSGALADKRGKALRKVVARDERAPVLDSYTAISARKAVAVGRGDVDGVRALLDGLDAIGKKARAGGFGRLRRPARVEPLDDAPESLGYVDFADRPVRVVPRGVWIAKGLPVDDVSFGPARPRLPRWATPDELCALPASHEVRPHELRRVGP